MTSSERTIVVGAGISGLAAALVLARQGRRVHVLERDRGPGTVAAAGAFDAWPRLGVAQFRHPHAFLARLCNMVADDEPALLRALLAAGARRWTFEEMLSPSLAARYRPEPDDARLWALLCRRATFEAVLRRHVQALPQVTVDDRQQVTGLEFACREGLTAVSGVRVRRRGEAGRVIPASVVVDAAGHGSRLPRWLAEQGRPMPEESHDVGIVYVSRQYRLRPGQPPPAPSEQRSVGDLGYLKFGVFPGDDATFSLMLCVPEHDAELRDAAACGAGFEVIGGSIPALAPWLAPGRSEPLTPPLAMSGLRAVWRDGTVDGEPLAAGVFAVGDGAMRTNPLYGRGCTTAWLQARMLGEVLAAHHDPVERARAYQRCCRQALRPIFDSALAEDRRTRQRNAGRADGAGGARRAITRYGRGALADALSAAGRREVHVFRGMLRSFHLLEPPGAFLREGRVQRTLLRYLLRGRRRNAASRGWRGPGREEMLARLRQPVG